MGEALDATLGVEERLARLAAPLVPRLADFCTIPAEGRALTRRPRDSAWVWYGIAAAALLVLLILDLTGVLGSLGP